ncbi:transcriptional repressor [Sphingobacterium spiritivorum]|uniref:transcriptional repressor n=1 Tax=Sphingobacterium spiritivorum TaxID=258 RepID=UPI003DA5CE0A
MSNLSSSTPVKVQQMLESYYAEQQLQHSKKRQYILENILLQRDWIDAVDLWISLQRHVSISCIYQTLKLLVKAGIVEQRTGEDRKTHYRPLLQMSRQA